MLSLYQILQLLLTVLFYIIMVQAIASWLIAFNVINMSNDFVRQFLYALDRITAPLYRPIRRVMPDFGGLDFSPIVLILLIRVVMTLVEGARFDVIRSMT